MAVLLMMLEMQVLVWALDRQSNSIFRQLLPFFQCFDNEVSDKGLKRLISEYNCLLEKGWRLSLSSQSGEHPGVPVLAGHLQAVPGLVGSPAGVVRYQAVIGN